MNIRRKSTVTTQQQSRNSQVNSRLSHPYAHVMKPATTIANTTIQPGYVYL